MQTIGIQYNYFKHYLLLKTLHGPLMNTEQAITVCDLFCFRENTAFDCKVQNSRVRQRCQRLSGHAKFANIFAKSLLVFLFICLSVLLMYFICGATKWKQRKIFWNPAAIKSIFLCIISRKFSYCKSLLILVTNKVDFKLPLHPFHPRQSRFLWGFWGQCTHAYCNACLRPNGSITLT